MNALEYEFDCGKNYEYLCQMLRIAISGLDRQIQKKLLATHEEQVQSNKLQEFLKESYLKALNEYGNLKSLAEPAKVLECNPY